jgi:tetratricopeptide (TPR) repeat protein
VDGRKKVPLLYPRGAEALAKKAPFLADLLERDLGRPVWFSVVFEAVEKEDVEPVGAAYRLVRDPGELARADVTGEWARYRRGRTLRGVLDSRVFRDDNTRSTLSYYAYGDYRRGYVLQGQGRCGEAMVLFRSALRWPDFYGPAPAGAHASIGGCLWKAGRTGEAIRELEEAARLSPKWMPPLRILAGIYSGQGRLPDALRVLRMVLAAEPGDAQATSQVRALESAVKAAPRRR